LLKKVSQNAERGKRNTTQWHGKIQGRSEVTEKRPGKGWGRRSRRQKDKNFERKGDELEGKREMGLTK